MTEDLHDPEYVSRAEHNEMTIRADTFEIALREILAEKATVTRRFDRPSPEDEIDATVPAGEYGYLQEIAAQALSTQEKTHDHL